MRFKRMAASCALSAGILLGSISFTYAVDLTYKVQAGDSFWAISQKNGVPIDKLMQANNATQGTVLNIGQNIIIPSDHGIIHTVNSGDTFWIISRKYDVSLSALMSANNATEKTVLNIGDKLVVPPKTAADTSQLPDLVHVVKPGDTFWIISQKYNVNIKDLIASNNASESTMLYVGQKIIIPKKDTSSGTTPASGSEKPYITYIQYTVKSGDVLWNLANSFGIPFSELLKANNLTESSVLSIGDVLKVPQHNIPLKATPGSKYGEYLDWWTEAQYVIPVNSIVEVVDFKTGKSFKAKRTTGASHADCEALTAADTKIIKEIWGGKLSWVSRPVIIKVNGRKVAASMSSMPHAGNDKAPGGVNASWRSDNYGYGYNFDWVKNNDMDGVFDIHFLNSTRHNDGKTDATHQKNTKIAAGIE